MIQSNTKNTKSSIYITNGVKIKTHIILLIFSLLSLHLSAQDKYKVVLPEGGEWEFDGDNTEFAPGEQVKLRYVGSKNIARVELTALPTKITLSPETLTLGVGFTTTLIPEIYPDFENVDKRVTWESNKTSVATVNENGKVTAVSPGTATITVKTVTNEKTAEITLIVPYFSVSATKKILFSPGNLQYNTGTKKFQFAASQTECMGKDQTTIKDLLGWGMWLDEITDEAKITNISTTGSDYSPELNGTEFKNNKTTVDGKVWFTLSKAEWDYLLKTRTNATEKYGVATVGDVNGLILLPDDFVFPEGVSFKSGIASTNGSTYYKTKNEYTTETWAELENRGAVFLSAAGYRYGTDQVTNIGWYGKYWTSTISDDTFSYYMHIQSNDVYCKTYYRFAGQPIRLVKEVVVE